MDKKHVVVVEDDPIALKSLSLILRDLFKITKFMSAEDALEFIKANAENIDIVITDNSLPGIDGWALSYHLKRFLKFKHIFVIMQSGKQSRYLKLMKYIDAFLEKPYKRQELIDILAKIEPKCLQKTTPTLMDTCPERITAPL